MVADTADKSAGDTEVADIVAADTDKPAGNTEVAHVVLVGSFGFYDIAYS